MHKLKFAVLGAGNGGKALAAHLAIKGFEVNLYNRSIASINPIIKLKGIDLEGEVTGFGKLNVVSSNMGKVLEGADVVMVVVPADGHIYMAEKSAEFLNENQVVLLNPGRTFGALEFLSILRKKGNKKQVTVAEAQTFIYASRDMGPASAKIFRIKQAIPVAAIPASKTKKVLKLVNEAFPEFIEASNVIETSFNNMGAVFHPSITILNASRIESTLGNFQFYIEGVTQSIARILESVDEERVKVARKLGCDTVYTAIEWLSMAYNVVEGTLFDAIHSNPGYVGIMAPRTINNRYITEDVPMSLVPISEFASLIGVKTPVIDSLINLANSIFRKDFRKSGRNIHNLGMEGLNLKQIKDYVLRGIMGEEK